MTHKAGRTDKAPGTQHFVTNAATYGTPTPLPTAERKGEGLDQKPRAGTRSRLAASCWLTSLF